MLNSLPAFKKTSVFFFFLYFLHSLSASASQNSLAPQIEDKYLRKWLE